ncbi:hypothetical protein ACLOJK_020005 [Asimina triloba]
MAKSLRRLRAARAFIQRRHRRSALSSHRPLTVLLRCPFLSSPPMLLVSSRRQRLWASLPVGALLSRTFEALISRSPYLSPCSISRSPCSSPWSISLLDSSHRQRLPPLLSLQAPCSISPAFDLLARSPLPSIFLLDLPVPVSFLRSPPLPSLRGFELPAQSPLPSISLLDLPVPVSFRRSPPFPCLRGFELHQPSSSTIFSPDSNSLPMDSPAFELPADGLPVSKL